MTPTQTPDNDDTVCICAPLACTYCGRRDWRPKVPGDECFLCGHPLAAADMPAAGCRAHADVDVGSDPVYRSVGCDDDEGRDGVWMRRLGADDTDCASAGPAPAAVPRRPGDADWVSPLGAPDCASDPRHDLYTGGDDDDVGWPWLAAPCRDCEAWVPGADEDADDRTDLWPAAYCPPSSLWSDCGEEAGP
jgi:hypothetical protein